MGEATMTFGKKCKIVGKVGFGMLTIGILMMIISFLIWLLFNAASLFFILVIICSLIMGIGLIMFPFFFIGQHFLCLGRIEMNTRLMFENQEKLNKKLITKINIDQQKKLSNLD